MTEETLTDIESDDTGSAIQQALSYANTQQLGLAIAIMQEAAVRHPSAVAVRVYLARFFAEGGRLDEAAAEAERAINLAPESEIASLSYFYTLWESKRYDEAFNEAKRFVGSTRSEEYARILDDPEFQAAIQ